MFTLTACEKETGEVNIQSNNSHRAASETSLKNELLDAVKIAKQRQENQEKKISMSLEMLNEKDDEIKVLLSIKNEHLIKFNSVRSFLSYNPDLIEATNIEIHKNLEEKVLFAPNEKNIDKENGLIKIGFSSISEIEPAGRITIAIVTFRRKSRETINIDFFDARDGGHTDIVGISRGITESLLKRPKSPALIINSVKEMPNLEEIKKQKEAEAQAEAKIETEISE